MRMQPFGRSEEGWWSGGSVARIPGTRVLSGPYEKFQMFVPDGIVGTLRKYVPELRGIIE